MVVDGASMEPTYAAHGFNVCVLTAYRSHPPARGDVVALKYGGTRYMLLKRVLAFEGESVAFSNGVCVVNGQALDEPYVNYPNSPYGFEVTVPEGQVAVMGDHRNCSNDSRQLGCFSIENIMGKALWRIFPTDKCGTVY